MTQLEIYQLAKTKFERPFSMNETLDVLRHNITIFWSWGVSKMHNFENKALVLKVSGYHHKGFVFITLAWDDTYSVYIVSNKGEIQEEYKNVFFDELTEIIDNRIERIERIAEYTR
jgi:hypothetical protein